MAMIRSYSNPILSGFHPDPSLCRMAQEYYLVTSTFHWFPGVPIYHSQDLVHWRCLGYALNRSSQLPLVGAASSAGIYAPTLRYHNGKFYLITTNISQGKNFMVVSEDPAAAWSEPIWLEVPGIDPSLLFDPEGKVYVQSTGQGDGIIQAEFDPQAGKVISSWRKLWSGTGGRYPEGPHLYRIGDYYYLLIAEGGTEYGHMITLARAQNPWGPFEPCPRNPILTHRNTQFHPIQGLGHGDLFQAEDGNWWLVFLAFRPVGGSYHHLGRETFLAPLTWEADGWPVVNQGKTIELEMSGPLPQEHPWPLAPLRDDFNHATLAGEWNFLRQLGQENWSLRQRSSYLRIQGQAITLDEVGSPTLVARRQQHFNVDVRTQIEFEPQRESEEAGLTVFMDEHHHAEIYITAKGQKRFIQFRNRIGSLVHIGHEMIAPNGPLVLAIEARTLVYHFKAGSSPSHLQSFGMAEARYLSTEVAGGFTGVYFGLYATGRSKPCSAPADFDWFDYCPK